MNLILLSFLGSKGLSAVGAIWPYHLVDVGVNPSQYAGSVEVVAALGHFDDLKALLEVFVGDFFGLFFKLVDTDAAGVRSAFVIVDQIFEFNLDELSSNELFYPLLGGLLRISSGRSRLSPWVLLGRALRVDQHAHLIVLVLYLPLSISHFELSLGLLINHFG